MGVWHEACSACGQCLALAMHGPLLLRRRKHCTRCQYYYSKKIPRGNSPQLWAMHDLSPGMWSKEEDI